MNIEYKSSDNPRIIAIQKIYGKFYNQNEDFNIGKHRFKKFIKDIVNGTIERNDLISMRGFTFKLEDRILNAIWDEE